MPHQRLTVFRTRFSRLNGVRPTPPGTLGAIADRLQVQLPEDFQRVCEFYDGTGLTTEDILPVAARDDAPSVVQQTLCYREELALPPEVIVIGASDDSVLLLKCAPKTGERGTVYRVARDKLAAWNLGTDTQVRSWPSFLDFFEDVLEQEEASYSAI